MESKDEEKTTTTTNTERKTCAHMRKKGKCMNPIKSTSNEIWCYKHKHHYTTTTIIQPIQIVKESEKMQVQPIVEQSSLCSKTFQVVVVKNPLLNLIDNNHSKNNNNNNNGGTKKEKKQRTPKAVTKEEQSNAKQQLFKTLDIYVKRNEEFAKQKGKSVNRIKTKLEQIMDLGPSILDKEGEIYIFKKEKQSSSDDDDKKSTTKPLLKIGRTERQTEERMKEWQKESTSKVVLLHKFQVLKNRLAEYLIHKFLKYANVIVKSETIKDKKEIEWFDISEEEALQVIKAVQLYIQNVYTSKTTTTK